MSNQETGQEEPVQKISPGAVLANARNSQGLSVAEVAEHLKITESYVRAIEQNAFDDLPQAAFVRGYIRNYAKMVGLNGQSLVDDFDEFTGDSSREAPRLQGGRKVKPLRAHNFPSPAHAFALVLVVSLAGLSYFLWNHWLSAEPTTSVVITEEVLVPDPVAADDVPILLAVPAELDEAAPDEASAVMPEDNLAVVDAGVEAIVPEIIAPEVIVPEAVTSELTKTLLIDFSQECWVEIRDANDVVLVAALQQAGSSIDMEVQPPVNVRFGNARGVASILFDGEQISRPDASVANIELTSSERG